MSKNKRIKISVCRHTHTVPRHSQRGLCWIRDLLMVLWSKLSSVGLCSSFHAQRPIRPTTFIAVISPWHSIVFSCAQRICYRGPGHVALFGPWVSKLILKSCTMCKITAHCNWEPASGISRMFGSWIVFWFLLLTNMSRLKFAHNLIGEHGILLECIGKNFTRGPSTFTNLSLFALHKNLHRIKTLFFEFWFYLAHQADLIQL